MLDIILLHTATGSSITTINKLFEMLEMKKKMTESDGHFLQVKDIDIDIESWCRERPFLQDSIWRFCEIST